MKKKYLFITNHIQDSDGVCNVLTEFLNAFDFDRCEVTLAVLYKADSEYLAKIDPRVRIRKVFGGYFRGLRIFAEAMPKRWLYRRAAGKDCYDAEIAFQAGTPTVIVAHSPNRSATRVAWMHGYDDTQGKEHALCDRIVCCARSTAEAYRKVFPHPERVGYLYNLVRDDEVRLKAKLPIEIERKDKVLCSVGRLSYEKGYDRLLICQKALEKEGFSHELWIVGGGSEEQKLTDYIRNENLRGVRMIGFDSNPYRWIARADAFICSSRFEGMSTACTEALILGVPVITTEVNGARELLESTDAGLVVDNDEDALYAGIKTFLTQPELAARWTSNAREKGAATMGYASRVRAAKHFFENL